MKTTPFTVKASIEASGRQLTLADMRAYVEATRNLAPDTKVVASCGDSQRDGAYWRFVAQFDPTVDLVTGGLR